ncbi:MAG: DUF3136 domain-containing protein [Synechococcus sp.]|nr:DUF3136 domain-containing protein [Synechococcus sp.]
MSVPPAITIGELEAKYPLYCKALRLLLLEGRSSEQLQRTLCWDRLHTLHHSLPRRYKAPDHLVAMYQREIKDQRAQLACS